MTRCAHSLIFLDKDMFHLHGTLKYYLYPFPVDMRKSFYTLSGIVTSAMKNNVREGGVFIFVNREQNIMKILHMEYAGLVIYHKKLDSGRFKLPSFDENTISLSLHWEDLMLMVESIKPRQKKFLKNVNNLQLA